MPVAESTASRRRSETSVRSAPRAARDEDIKRRPDWSFAMSSMDDMDGLLRRDPTDSHLWCTGYPCGVTTAMQLRARGKELKESGLTRAHYPQTRSSQYGDAPVHVGGLRPVPSMLPPAATMHGSVRSKTRPVGDDWMRSVSKRGVGREEHYKLLQSQRTSINMPRPRQVRAD